MFICFNCGEVFDEPAVKPCRTGEYDHYNVCPFCGHDEYDGAEMCDECGDYFPVDELNNGVCHTCRKEYA